MATPPPAKRFKPNKFGAKKLTLDGITFDSHREARRYQALRMEERAGHVSDIQLQVKYPCIVNDNLVCTYIADFVYRRGADLVVEDAKGFATPEFKLKSKLVTALYGVTILLS